MKRVNDLYVPHSAQGMMCDEKPAACGSACGAADPAPEKPAACGAACGAGDK